MRKLQAFHCIIIIYSIINYMENAAFYITLKLIQLRYLILFDQSELSIPH